MFNRISCFFYTVKTSLPALIFGVASLFVSPQLLASDEKIDLTQYQGKVIYLDFWASWCVPCRRSFPWLNDMEQKYKDQGFKIVAINLDEEKQLAETFLQQYPAIFKIHFDPQGNLAQQYKLKGMPSSFILDKDGKVKFSHVGFRTNQLEKYEQHIIEALNEGE